MTKEYRIFELDKYDNAWFEMSYSGNPEIQKRNAEMYVASKQKVNPEARYKIEEV